MICDISSVISDFLYLNKPLIVYRPTFIKDIHKEYPITKCAYIIDSSSNIGDLINQIRDNDYLFEEREKVRKYMIGDDESSIDNVNKALEFISTRT